MDTKEVVIEQVTSFSSDIVDAVRKLAKQIGDNYKPLSDDDLKEIIASPGSFLYIARDSATQQAAGMVMVSVYRIPYTKKAYIDDLIVDETFRKRGIATQLMQAAITLAKEKKAAYVDFTSRPRRAAGNTLYEKLGFQKRETNTYRLIINYDEV